VVTTGQDVLPNGRPVIFVANHSSHLDTPMILLSLPDSYRRRTAVAAAADYFFDTWWRAFVSSLVFNTFPVERKAGGLTDLPGTLLRSGWSMVVYPEGTRSPDGWMTRFRMGAAWLAVEHQVPVVPIALRGSFAAMPRGSRWPRPGRPEVRLRFGPAVEPAEGESIRQFAPRVQAAVAALLDEDAGTWWGAQQRAASHSTPDPTGPKKAAQWRRLWEQAGAPTKASARLQAWRGRGGRR
jgi:1-acyl-sn-glycerol-3-phosphate acyltransferase